MDELQVSAMENKPVYRVSAAGLDPRDVRLIEIVFKHSQYNPFGFVLDAKLDPEAVDILIVNPVETEGLRAVARVRTVGRQVPVISAVPRGAPSTGRYALSIDRLTLQLLPILNRVVEMELGGGQAPAAAAPIVPSPPPVPQATDTSPSAPLPLPAAAPVPAQAQEAPANPLHLDLPTRDFLRRAADKSREGDQLRELAARSGRWPPDLGQAADASPPGLQWMLRKPDASLAPAPSLDEASRPPLPSRPPQAPRGPESGTAMPPGLADLQLPDLRLPERPVSTPAAQNSADVRSAAGAPEARSGLVGPHPQGEPAASGSRSVPADSPNASRAVPASAPLSVPPVPSVPPTPSASPLPVWARDPQSAASVRQGGAAASMPPPGAGSAGTTQGAGPGTAAGTGTPPNLVALPLNTDVPPARIRVLVVDDSPTVRQQLARAFARMAIICDAAASAAEALQRLAERHFDLVLVDVVMPDVDGYKLTRQIRRQHRGTPVIILTSRSSPFDLARGALAGCHTYLVKPVPLKQLEAAVVKLLRKSLAIDDLTGMIRLSGDAAARASGAARPPDESGSPGSRSPRSARE